MTACRPVVLKAKGISKTFPGVRALDEVDFELVQGEVHALVGENGAGKSTLMQILAGIYRHDAGEILVEGKLCEMGSKREAEAAGIRIMFQESSLLQNLTVCENVFSGEPMVGALGLIHWRAMEQRATALLKELAVDVNPNTLISSLSLPVQKMIEIARALSKDFKILILDEPTAAITVEETAQLFKIIKKLKKDGKSIVYISHRLKELREIADRVTILKDGKRVGTFKVEDMTEKEICEKMVGRELANFQYRSQAREQMVLEVSDLCGVNFKNVSFNLREGEFLTITGLSGAGRTELALSLFGALPIESGSVAIDGVRCRLRSPRDAMKAGIGYVTEDRKKRGLFMEMGIAENMESNNIDTLTPGPFSVRQRVMTMAIENVKAFNIRCSGIAQKVQTLSGGNQQKVCLSRWITINPRILIVDEPTLGVDVGAKEAIYTILNRLTEGGTSIIMISSDMIETLALGDRIMVMCAGEVMRVMDRVECSEEDVVALASGLVLNEVFT
jgi:ABC-type sugar transport system ATPase subunit